MKNYFLSLVIMMVSVSFAFAAETDGRAEGKAFGAGQRGTVENILKVQPTSEIVPGYGGTDAVQTDYSHEVLTDPEQKDLDSTGIQARDVVNFRAAQGAWREPEGTFDSAQRIIESPMGVAQLENLISSKYGDCQTTSIDWEVSQEHFCDSRAQREADFCQYDRKVGVHKDTLFQCERDNEFQRVVCERKLTQSCSRQYESQDVGGALLDLDSRGIKDFVEESGRLVIGNPGGKVTWDGTCKTFNGRLIFNIPNVDAIKELKIIHVEYDDWTHIRLNGNAVYVGPRGDPSKGGIEVRTFTGTRQRTTGGENGSTETVRYSFRGVGYLNGGLAGPCELATHWGENTVRNINLLPHLVEGVNTLDTRTIVTGTGHFSSIITIKHDECGDFSETWTETCE